MTFVFLSIIFGAIYYEVNNRFHVSSLEIKTTAWSGRSEIASHLLKVEEDSILHSLLDDNIVHED